MPSSVGRGAMQSAIRNFSGSNPARKGVFSELASALATGGRGMKSSFVHGAVANSNAAGQQALRTGGGDLAGVPMNVRSRVLNRVNQQTNLNSASIGPSYASQLISQAPNAVEGGVAAQTQGYQVGAEGEREAAQAAQTKAAGATQAIATGVHGAGAAYNMPTQGGTSTAGADTASWLKSFFTS